jgi:hypothetical protein
MNWKSQEFSRQKLVSQRVRLYFERKVENRTTLIFMDPKFSQSFKDIPILRFDCSTEKRYRSTKTEVVFLKFGEYLKVFTDVIYFLS